MSYLPPYPAWPGRYGAILLSGTAFGLAIGPMLAQAGGVDSLQLQLSWQLQQPLRWDNVHLQDAYWVAGEAEPVTRADTAFKVLRLQAGQSISLRLPAGEFLRLQAASGPIKAHDISLWRSASSADAPALSLRENYRISDQGQSLLLDQFVDQVRLIRIEAAPHLRQPLELGVFVSRHESFHDLASYRKLLALPGKAQALRADHEGAAQSYWAMQAGQSQQITVRGPARLALQGRFQYPANEAALTQNWQVRVRLDGSSEHGASGASSAS
ncbi:MAG: hypothetical protein RL748_2775, partial [Pseudomonadota bacterium]